MSQIVLLFILQESVNISALFLATSTLVVERSPERLSTAFLRTSTEPERDDRTHESVRTFQERLAISAVFCETVPENVFTVSITGARAAAKITI